MTVNRLQVQRQGIVDGGNHPSLPQQLLHLIPLTAAGGSPRQSDGVLVPNPLAHAPLLGANHLLQTTQQLLIGGGNLATLLVPAL
jgi:hypothetical protein